MSNVSLQTWFPNGKRRAPKGWALPDLFSSAINKYWVRKSRGPLVGVILDRPSEQAWKELGALLVNGLAGPSNLVGACLHSSGGVPREVEEAILAWTQRATGSLELGHIALTWDVRTHPMNELLEVEMPNVSAATWCAIQTTSEAGWVGSLWEDLRSDLFHVDTYLLFAVYSADEHSRLEMISSSTTVDTFGKTLDRALGWLVPVDSNIGFVLGLSTKSKLYEDLKSGACTSFLRAGSGIDAVE